MPEPRDAQPETDTALTRFGAAFQRRLAHLVGRPLFWLGVVALIASYPIGRSIALARDMPKAPAMSLPLPPFELVNQRGEPFTLEDLRGKIWVADFIFTSCPTVCPRLTQRMVQVQHRGRNLGDHFHLVSFTVDPENDTPERLAAYARASRANERRWTFATGTLGALETTIVKGFKIAMGKEEQSPGIFEVFHGERLVLVDREGDVRGYYEASDEGIDDLMRDIGLLVNER